LGYRPVVAVRDPWYFSFGRGAFRLVERNEDEFLPVPSWETFLSENYPEVLIHE